MYRLIAICFRDGNVIFELARHWFVKIVNNSKNAIAGIHLVDNNSKREDIDSTLRWHELRARRRSQPEPVGYARMALAPAHSLSKLTILGSEKPT